KLISERAPKASLISAEGNIRETLDLDIDAWLIRCEFIVNEMQAIDLSGCPDDFAQAYRNHCGSWFIAWKVFNNMKDDNIIYYSIIHKYNARIRKIRETDKAIHDTYNKLLELASQYRVQISRYQGQYGLVSLHN
ncbi:MAG: hypothetical protein J5833_03060, partial [Victivallales bacterium]|nr:hypothetical protein [Victivallales bacterium]